MAPLTPDEIRRYARHLILPEVGVEGQERLRDGSALIVGAGGLGSPLALYLAAAGVGTIGLVDFDRVDESNLQRQIVHGTADVGRPKTESAADAIAAVNPLVRVVPIDERLTATNALDVLRDWDVVADGTDNFPTRYLVNDACVLLGKPNAYGSIFRFEGQASVFAHDGGPCYRCLYPEPPPPGLVPSCAEGGVLGVLPGVIGTIQATEVVKLLLGIGETLAGRLLLYDALTMRFREMRVRRDPDCPVCGDRPRITTLADADDACATGVDEAAGIVTAPALARWLAAGEDVQLLDVRTPEEWRIARLPNATLVPLPDLPGQLGALDPSRRTVIYCHTGIRSAQACHFLHRAGFGRVLNLVGGIESWSRDVDPSVPRY